MPKQRGFFSCQDLKHYTFKTPDTRQLTSGLRASQKSNSLINKTVWKLWKRRGWVQCFWSAPFNALRFSAQPSWALVCGIPIWITAAFDFPPHSTWNISHLYSINTECSPIDCASMPVKATWLVCCLETGHFIHKVTHLCLCAKTPSIEFHLPQNGFSPLPPALNSPGLHQSAMTKGVKASSSGVKAPVS